MKYFIISLMFLSCFVQSQELKRIDNNELSHILGTMVILFESKSVPFVRVIESSEEIMECGGTFESCPNSRLFLIYSMGDLGEAPLLYELPKSKGWKLLSTKVVNDELLISLETTLERANISQESREKWKSKTYSIKAIIDYGLTYAVK
jgi:hypothetical protein